MTLIFSGLYHSEQIFVAKILVWVLTLSKDCEMLVHQADKISEAFRIDVKNQAGLRILTSCTGAD